jgi:AcrR family transcriptional regulator
MPAAISVTSIMGCLAFLPISEHDCMINDANRSTAVFTRMKKRPRKYQLKARAESQEQTRQRITVAAMELHEEIGLVRTSISAVAERAGVQRLTVYRHFPDEISLFRACGGHYRALHPFPDPAKWAALTQPKRRLRVGLLDLYGHFRETEAMWAHVLRDVELSEVVRLAAEPRFRYLRDASAVLSEGWSGRLARAAIAHAVQFRTWQSLANEQLSDDDAAALMARLAGAASTAM